MTKTEFLENLENALNKVIGKLFNDGGDPEKNILLAQQVEEFVRDNASEYSLAELMETFTSADAAIGLFMEFQDAKRLCGERIEDA